MEWSVKHRLMAFGVVAVLLTASVCLVGLNGQRHLNTALDRTGTASTVLRNHLEADMMHDALRGDVLNALHASATSNRGAYEESVKDLQEHVENFRARIKDNEALAFDEGVSKAIQEVKPALETYQQRAQAIVGIAFDQRIAAEAQFPEFLESFSVLEEAMGTLSDQINARVETISADATATARQSQSMMYAVLVGSAILMLVLSWLFGRGILIPLRQLYEAIDRMRHSENAGTAMPQFKAEFRMVGDAVNGVIAMIEEKRREEMKLAMENQRVRNALDNVSSNVMIADNEGRLVYMNNAIRSMLKKSEAGIRKELPEFDAGKLDGASMSIFHRNPSHQARLLQGLTGTHNSRIRVGGHTFDLSVNPVVDADGQRLGSVVEWADRTAQVEAEEQVKQLIAAASRGELDSRVDASGFDGFMRQLLDGINNMLDAIVSPLNVAATHIQRIANGDIPDPISGDYHGSFATLVNNVNTCSAAVNTLVTDMNALALAATAGRLDERADIHRHRGEFRNIVEGVNNTLDAIVGPLSTAAENIERIARGDIPA